MKTLNWGFGIASVFIVFVIFMICMVVKAHMYTVDLVSEDYYEKEIKFQKQIDKLNNGSEFTDSLQWIIKKDFLVLNFKNCKIDYGKITFFNPSNPKKDFTSTLSLDKNQDQYFSRKEIKFGYYKVQLDWTFQGKKYYIEKDLIIE